MASTDSGTPENTSSVRPATSCSSEKIIEVEVRALLDALEKVVAEKNTEVRALLDLVEKDVAEKTTEDRALLDVVKKAVEAIVVDALREKYGVTSDRPLLPKNDDKEADTYESYYLIFPPPGRFFLVLYSGIFLFAWFGPLHDKSWLCENYLIDIISVALGPNVARGVCREIMTMPIVKRAARNAFGLSQRRWSQAVAVTELIVMFAVWPFTFLRSQQDMRTCGVVS